MSIRLVFNPQTGWKGSVKSEEISFRELTILTMIAQGDSYEKIAEIQIVSVQETVSFAQVIRGQDIQRGDIVTLK